MGWETMASIILLNLAKAEKEEFTRLGRTLPCWVSSRTQPMEKNGVPSIAETTIDLSLMKSF